MKIFGVDIGNVLIENRDTTEEYRQKYYLSIPPVSGVFSALKKISDAHPGNVYLISKCKKEAEEHILEWLHAHNFFKETGIHIENILFVRERSGKVGICKQLGITHFIDDRLEVLSHMVDTVPYLFLYRPNEEEVLQFKEFLPEVTVINEWGDIFNI